LILIPAVVIAVIGCTITYLLPDTYRSEARILIIAQRVPESYVRSTVTTRIEDRLRSIDAQVRSRAKLERIIEDFNLYPERRQTEILQDVIDDMNRNIDVNLVQGDVFRVAFTADNPRVAKDVAERLTTFFIEESLKDRTALAENTSEFLETEAGIAQRKLREVEQKIMEYKRRHDGELPTQADANGAALQNAQMQLQSLDNQIAQNRDNQAMLLRRVADLQTRVEDASKMPPAAVPVEPGRPMTKAAALAAKQAEFQKERAVKAVGHPTIDRLLREIKQLEEEAAEEAASATPLGTTAAAAPLANPLLERATKELDDTKSDLSRLERRIDADLESQRVVRQQIAEFQRRILAAPMRDTELVDLTRDYNTLKAHYDSLSSKRIDSQVSANVERRQIGEQFRILDPARLPERPHSPNREQLYVVSLVLALAVGLTAAAGAEYLDRGLRSEDDVRLALALPVLATIPVIGPAKKVGRRWKLLGASAAVVVVLSGAVSAAWMALR
jgi:polysaccharide chain length determinant protein (PEP-CTERM system associated)